MQRWNAQWCGGIVAVMAVARRGAADGGGVCTPCVHACWACVHGDPGTEIGAGAGVGMSVRLVGCS